MSLKIVLLIFASLIVLVAIAAVAIVVIFTSLLTPARAWWAEHEDSNADATWSGDHI